MQCKRCATLEAELEFSEPSTPHVDFLSQEGFRRKIRFYNLKSLSRGSIREPPNPITWLHGLISLQTTGGWDSGNVIKAWNEQAAKPERLVGQRFMTVKNVLALDGPVRDHITQTVNKNGWRGHMHASKFSASCEF